MTVPGLAGQYAEMPHKYPHDGSNLGYHPEHAKGWLMFAAIMLGIVGTLNVIFGIAAISDSAFFVKTAKYIALSSLNAWGWIFVALGLFELAAAVAVWRRLAWGAMVGITVAAFNMLGSLFSIRSYPFWALTVVALDLLVIYGLSVYGGRGSRTLTG